MNKDKVEKPKVKPKVKKPKVKPKKTKAKRVSKSKKSKKPEIFDDGVIVVEDDLTVDKEKELEERRAFLEEARSQDSSD